MPGERVRGRCGWVARALGVVLCVWGFVLIGGAGASLATASEVHADGRCSASLRAPGVVHPGAVDIPVWAFAGDDAPVVGARVRVFRTGRGGGLGGCVGDSVLTNANGVAVVRVARAVKSFTVVVSGGRVGGRQLSGRLLAVVKDFVSPAVVAVTPVSTLADLELVAHPRMRAVGARRAVDRLLGVPSWVSDDDLRLTNRWFDGDVFVAAARKAGGLGVLDRRLLGDIAHHHRARFAIPRARASVSPRARASDDGFNPVATVFEQLLANALTKPDYAVLGWLADLFGLHGLFDNTGLTKIQQQLDQIEQHLVTVQAEIEQNSFDALVAGTAKTVGDIASAEYDLSFLAHMSSTDPTRMGFTGKLLDKIYNSGLLEAPSVLNAQLAPSAPGAEGVLVTASKAVVSKGRFFTSKSSAAVRAVYDYFAGQQAQLAILLTEYWHAEPTDYSGTYVKGELANLQTTVEVTQAKDLKPSVPAGTVIDTHTLKMWTQDYSVNPPIYGTFWPAHVSDPAWIGPRSISGTPFSDWMLPTTEDYDALVKGWQGKSPVDWLEQEAGMSGAQLHDSGASGPSGDQQVDPNCHSNRYVHCTTIPVLGVKGYMWVEVPYYPHAAVHDYWRYDLNGATSEGLDSALWPADGIYAGIAYTRSLGAGESYWYGPTNGGSAGG